MRPTVDTIAPFTHAQRVAVFGEFKFEANPRFGNTEGIRIDREWVRQNIVELTLPQLAQLGPNHRVTHAINVHYKVAQPLLALWAEWEKLGFLPHIQTWNGSWVPRLKRGHTNPKPENLSNHSWGTAFDINARLYPLGKPVPASSPMHEMARIAAHHGFAWGGHFKKRPDGMHFELAIVPSEGES